MYPDRGGGAGIDYTERPSPVPLFPPRAGGSLGLWHHGPVITLLNGAVLLAGIYVGLGLLFGVPFVLRGVDRVDPVAREGSWGFRLIVLPGAVALWPLLARRWLAGAPQPQEHNAHRRAARGRT